MESSDNTTKSSHGPQDSSVCPELPAGSPGSSVVRPSRVISLSVRAVHRWQSKTGWLDILERSRSSTDMASEMPLAAFMLCEDILPAPADLPSLIARGPGTTHDGCCRCAPHTTSHPAHCRTPPVREAAHFCAPQRAPKALRLLGSSTICFIMCANSHSHNGAWIPQPGLCSDC